MEGLAKGLAAQHDDGLTQRTREIRLAMKLMVPRMSKRGSPPGFPGLHDDARGRHGQRGAAAQA